MSGMVLVPLEDVVGAVSRAGSARENGRLARGAGSTLSGGPRAVEQGGVLEHRPKLVADFVERLGPFIGTNCPLARTPGSLPESGLNSPMLCLMITDLPEPLARR